MTLDPKKSVFRSEEPRPKRVIRIAITVSLLAVAATLGVVIYSINAKDVVPLYFAIGLWAIGPPAWFWYEYYWLYRKYGEPDTLELFKYGQDVSKAIWAGVLAGLIALAVSGAVK